MIQPLNNSQLPLSVHAGQPGPGVSSKYAFLPTIDVVDALRSEGIEPYLAKSSHSRIDGKQGYTKHMLRFRDLANSHSIVGDVFPEVVLTNSHDRASSFYVDLGLYRLICKNGLVVSHGHFSSYRVRHVATTVGDVLTAVKGIIDQFPQVAETVQRMQSIQLTAAQRENMAALAVGLRWDADKAPFHPSRLLETRRIEDSSTDLWTTYNVIQENLMTGQQGRRRGYWITERNRGSREVKSIDTEMTVNRGLWDLAVAHA